MTRNQWKIVKKTFNALGISKKARPKSSNDADDDSHYSDEDQYSQSEEGEEEDQDEDTRKQASQTITTGEPAKTKMRESNKKQSKEKERQSRNGKKSDRNVENSDRMVEDLDRNVDKAENLARARALREELKVFKKRTEEDIFLCNALGMDTDGMCVRHPNQPITTLGPTFEEVNLCRICDSESQLGAKAPRQRKSMAGVINQVKAMQANRSDWRQRTKVMFWTSKQDLDFESDDDKAIEAEFSLTQEEWEKQVTARVTQVVAWRDENQLQAHPIFSRYFKMLEMGVPLEAAKNDCEMDGYNPGVLDLDPAKSLKSQLGKFDKKTRSELEALDSISNKTGQDNLDIPEMVSRVRTSFQKQQSRSMLEAVQTLDDLTDKAKKKEEKRSLRAEKEHSKQKKQKKPSSKEKKKSKKVQEADGTGEVPKKKRSKRSSAENSKELTKKASTDKKEKKVKKPRSEKKKKRKVKEMEPIREVDNEDTVGDSAPQEKIEALNLASALAEKEKEIQNLKEQLRQKDAIIQNLSRITPTSKKSESNEAFCHPIPSRSNSERAVIAPRLEDDKEIGKEVLPLEVEYDLKGYDFSTGRSNDDRKDEGESAFHEYNIALKGDVLEHGEVEGDDSIHSEASEIDGNDASSDIDDNASSHSDLLSDDEDIALWTPTDATSQETVSRADPHSEVNSKHDDDNDAENVMGFRDQQKLDAERHSVPLDGDELEKKYASVVESDRTTRNVMDVDSDGEQHTEGINIKIDDNHHQGERTLTAKESSITSFPQRDTSTEDSSKSEESDVDTDDEEYCDEDEGHETEDEGVSVSEHDEKSDSDDNTQDDSSEYVASNHEEDVKEEDSEGDEELSQGYALPLVARKEAAIRSPSKNDSSDDDSDDDVEEGWESGNESDESGGSDEADEE